MSFGFGVSDFITVGGLLVKLCQDFGSAPAEGKDLANDLTMLQDCIANLGKSSAQYGPEDHVRLATYMKPVRELLEDIDKLRERFSSLTSSQPGVWDRLKFPKLQIQAMQKRVHMQITTLNLFVGTHSSSSLVRIEEYLKGMVKSRPGDYSIGDDERWNILLPELQQRGMERESAERCRDFIEQHLLALSEVEVAESQLEDHFEGTIGPDDAVDAEIVVGPPTAEHHFSCICPGALALQRESLDSIKESKSRFYRHFGGKKFQLSCRHCSFHGFQDEPVKNVEGQITTPRLFCSRKEALSPTSTEYYVEAHKDKHNLNDGIYYHTLFFWKCHVKATEPTKHDAGRYECVFCPPERSYGVLYDRKRLVDHIRKCHVQIPPSQELRKKFNVYIDTRPALYQGEESRLLGRKFDILLPRALGRTDMIRAEQAQKEAEEKRIADEKKAEEERIAAAAKKAEDDRRKAEEKLELEAKKAENEKAKLIWTPESALKKERSPSRSITNGTTKEEKAVRFLVGVEAPSLSAEGARDTRDEQFARELQAQFYQEAARAFAAASVTALNNTSLSHLTKNGTRLLLDAGEQRRVVAKGNGENILENGDEGGVGGSVMIQKPAPEGGDSKEIIAT